MLTYPSSMSLKEKKKKDGHDLVNQLQDSLFKKSSNCNRNQEIESTI